MHQVGLCEAPIHSRFRKHDNRRHQPPGACVDFVMSWKFVIQQSTSQIIPPLYYISGIQVGRLQVIVQPLGHFGARSIRIGIKQALKMPKDPSWSFLLSSCLMHYYFSNGTVIQRNTDSKWGESVDGRNLESHGTCYRDTSNNLDEARWGSHYQSWGSRQGPLEQGCRDIFFSSFPKQRLPQILNVCPVAAEPGARTNFFFSLAEIFFFFAL